MSFFSDTQHTADQYGKYITEFQELFSTHAVSFGTPKDFFRLAPKLAYDEDFRVEFTALVQSVQKQEEGRLSLMEMLSMIAVAMGGHEIERVGSTGAVPISLVVVFLSEIGGWNETEPALVGAAQGEAESMNRDGATGMAGGGQAEEEREAVALEQRLTSGEKEGLEGVAASLFSGPALMKEALSRLELNTLQLKLHLDSIDSRMERIEPHLDDLTWRFAVQPEAPAAEMKTGTSDERRTRFSPEMKPWPTKKEEDSLPPWEKAAIQMRPWPVEKEKDLILEPKASVQEVEPERAAAPAQEWDTRENERARESTAPRPAAHWREAIASLQERERRERQAEPSLREPIREPEPVREPVVRESFQEPVPVVFEPVQEPVAQAVVSPVELEVREPLPREAALATAVVEPVVEELVIQKAASQEPVVREPALQEELPRRPLFQQSEPVLRTAAPELVLREPSTRVPFGEYLRDEDDEVSGRRWGRWVVAVLLVVLVAGGALTYRSYGWQGFENGWQMGKGWAGAVMAKAHLAMDEAKGSSSKPAASASVPDSTGGGETAASPASPAAASQVAPGQAASVQTPPTTAAAAQQPGSVVGAGAASASGQTQPPAQRAVAPQKKRLGVAVEEAGVDGGGSSSGTIAAAPRSATQAFGGGVAAPFVEASRLTVLSKTQPDYPNDAQAQRITGEVVVQAIISPAGTVESAQIVSGPAGLLKASLDAMKGWRYRPYLVNGEPTEVRTFVKFRFGGDE